MSNTAVGGVYQAIIEEVINSSRVDFEESGVEESVLEELRKVSNQSVSLNLFPSRSLCRGRRLGSVGSPSTVSPRAAGAHACDLHTKEAQGKETNKKKRRENRDSIRESQRCAQKAAGLDGDELGERREQRVCGVEGATLIIWAFLSLSLAPPAKWHVGSLFRHRPV
jgi:hypothetical protein